MVKRYDVEGVWSSNGRFSHVGEIGPNARLFHLAGQTGTAPDGRTGKDIVEQAELVYRNIGTVLEQCGLDFSNLVKVTVFLINPEDADVWRETQKKHFGDVVPASTLLYISRLARPELLLEVEAIAAAD
jgi:2-iminobutanoate/2-iminopropanoate deaminase